MSGGLSLRVLEYNVLAKRCVNPRWTPFADRRVLRWKHRREHLAEVLKASQADVMCLVEVDMYEDEEPFLREVLSSSGYDSIFRQRPEKTDGCVIAWDRKKLSLFRAAACFLDDVGASVKSTVRHGDAAEDVQEFYERRSIGTFAALCLNDAPEVGIVVGTSHLFWNPALPRIKIAQTAMLRLCLSEFRAAVLQERIRRDRGGAAADAVVQAWPVIVAGDFNSLPGSVPHQLLLQPLAPVEPTELAWDRGISAGVTRGEFSRRDAAEATARSESDAWTSRLAHYLVSVMPHEELHRTGEDWESSFELSPAGNPSGRGRRGMLQLCSSLAEASAQGKWATPLPITLSPVYVIDRETLRDLPDELSGIRLAAVEAADRLGRDELASLRVPIAVGGGDQEAQREDSGSHEAPPVIPGDAVQSGSGRGEPFFTTWVERFQGCIDYIFFGSAHGSAVTLSLESADRLPAGPLACAGSLGMPNVMQPSDHLPVVATLHLRVTVDR